MGRCQIDDIYIFIGKDIIDFVIDLCDMIFLCKGKGFFLCAVGDTVEFFVHFLQCLCHFISDHAGTDHCPVQFFLHWKSTSFLHLRAY